MPTTNKDVYIYIFVCVELCGEIEKIFHLKTYTMLYVILKKSLIRYLGMMIRIVCLVVIGCAIDMFLLFTDMAL